MIKQLNLNTATTNLIRRRVLKAFALLRLKPFDTSTVEGRSTERLRRVFWTAATSALAKAVNTLTMLVSVPIILAHLGAERYGLWVAITSIVVFLGFADLGIGNVVLNLVSEANGQNDVEKARKHISNAFFVLVSVSTGMALIFIFIHPHIRWDQFFNVSSSLARQEASPAVAVFVVCFLVNLPLSIIPRIQIGYQEGYISGMWQAISNLIGLIGIVTVVQLEAGLPWLVLVIASTPIVGNFLNGIGLFALQRPWLVPRRQDANVFVSKKILRVGSLFLILQIANAVIFFSDNIIIAKTLGPEAVMYYAIPVRLFLIILNVLYMVLAPLWPAYGEARSRGDERWLRTTLVRAVLVTFFICSILSVFLIVFGEKILRIWVGKAEIYSLSLMVSLGVWTTLSSIVTAMALFLNAINKIGFQATFVVPMAIVSTLLKLALIGAVGLPGIIWSNVGASIVFLLIPYAIYLTRQFAKY